MKKIKKLKMGLYAAFALCTMFSMITGVSARKLSQAYNNYPSDANLKSGPRWVVHKATDGKMGYCMNAEKANGQAGYSYTLKETENSTYNSTLRTQYGYIIKALSKQKGDARQYYLTQYSIYKLQNDLGIIGERWSSSRFDLKSIDGINIKKIVDESKKVSNNLVVNAPSKATLSDDGNYYVAEISIKRPSITTIVSVGDISVTGYPSGAFISSSKNGTKAVTSLSEGKKYYLKVPVEVIESQSSGLLNVTITASASTSVAVGRQYCRNGDCDTTYQNLLFMDEVPENHSGSASIRFQIECNFDNPSHFHKTDGSDDQDYKSTGKTATCCAWAIRKYGEEETTNRYPICGACEVETDSNPKECKNGSTAALTLTDVSNVGSEKGLNAKFECLYQGVSGKGANKYDYSARESVRQKYKVTSVNEYCEVYCIDDIVANFPGNFLGIVAPGGTFQWPSYNDDYEATVTRTRTCKMRFRQQEWLSAFNSGNKTTLLEKLKTCANSTMETVTTNYKKVKNPSLSVSYNNGATKIGPKTLKVAERESSLTSACSNCSANTSNINTSNVVSQLNNLATQIENKVLTITQNLKYVLPDGLYQYVDNNQGGKYLETYNPNNGSSSAKKTDSSNLLVSEDAKPGNKYDLTIEYDSMSPVSNKFDKTSGKYECNYTPDKSSVPNTCDVNEINHFKDLNGDGKLDSGPNGEDCCEWVADKFGKDSDTYQELVEKGLCPVTPPDNGSGCTYPDDLDSADFETKKKCCSMVLVDQDSSLSEEKRKEFYQEYCDNGGNGDPYCPQDCEDGVCHDSPMTQRLRNCMNGGKSYNECKVDNCPGGGSIVIYRPISLLYEEAFPGVEDENRIVSNNNWYYYSNWAYRGGGTKLKDYYVDRDITNNRGVEEYEVYNMAPMYVIDLDAAAIGKVRQYNKTHSYDDFTLECKDGRQCTSTFLRHSDITSKISGCGMSNNWYACQGISKDRGD